MYEVASPLKLFPFGAPGIKYANSPLNEKFDGTLVFIFGSLFTSLVSIGNSVEKFPSNPTIVLFIGSVPKLAF